MAHAYAAALLGDHALAQDATQEAFIDARAKLAALRDANAFPGWLKAIVRKHCDRTSRSKAFRAGDEAGLEAIAWDGAGIDERLSREETARLALRALRSLSPTLREVAALYYTADYSTHDIGAFLELPLTTVKKRLADARIKLRSALQETIGQRIEPMLREQLRERAPSRSDALVDTVAFRLAVAAADVVAVRMLAAKSPALCRMPANDGQPMLLHVLHRTRHGEGRGLVAALLEHGAEYDIYSAAAHGGVADVERLLAADPALLEAEAYWQMTPLKWAAHGGNDAVVAHLLDRGADARHVGTGWTCLHQAAEAGHVSTVDLLLAQGADLDARIDGRWTALHVAAEGGQAEMVAHLARRGLPYDLFAAAALGDLAQATRLLDADPTLVAQTLPKRLTPLGMASQSRRPELARLLVARGAKADLLDLYQLGWHDELRAAVRAAPERIDELSGVLGQTVLHAAVCAADLDMLRFLLDHGADPDRPDLTYASSARGWAVYFDAHDVVVWLDAYSAEAARRGK
jgi:RNA polymerase sigma factor (sigma-70 family)